ncbi:MAG: flavodoxin [Oscillospiraceae bacterium]|nr:flavodoxin [Oscillospiraceae bacterium]
MRNIFIKISAIFLAISLSACNRADSIDITSQSQISESSSVSSTSQGNDNSSNISGDDADSNILIAYFTWADNAHVEEPDKVDIDATTSASVLVPGNAAKIADWIHRETGGDLFSIIVTEPYSSDYNECLDRAADEKAKNARPQLAEHIDDMEKYDIVFLGFPNWWYTVPMAIHTFLEEYDFSGKTIIPFVTHGTGGLASTITDIKADLPKDVTLLDPIGVYRPEVDSSHDNVIEWLKTLDILKEDL